MPKQGKTNTSIGGYDYYKVSATIGYDIEGKPIRKIFYGKNKGDAESKKKEYLKMLENGINPDVASQPLSKVIWDWFWNIEKNSGNKSSTFERYDVIFRKYIKDSAIGKLSLSSINKMTIRKYYNELLAEGHSMSIIKNTHKFLNKFFVFALSEGYIIRNPLYGLKLPTVNEDDIDENEGKIETFTDEEINTLAKSIGNDKLKYIVLFAVMTGARMGEILALEKTDIKNGIVKINKSVRTVRIYTDESNYRYERKTTRPKNKSSIREIPLPDVLIKEMKNLNALVNEERLKLGPAYLDNKLLFPSQTGTYIDDKNLRKSWQRAIAKTGIKYRKFHCLRHTYATRMILNGVSILTVSRLLGHSSIKTTEIYAHTLEDMKIQAVKTLNTMLQ
mgnify:FL=1